MKVFAGGAIKGVILAFRRLKCLSVTQYVAADQLYMLYAINIYPDLQGAVRLPSSRVFTWALPLNARPEFHQKVDDFISTSQVDRTLPRLRDKRFGYIRRLNALNKLEFIADIERKLPPFRAHFHKAQEATGIDWRQFASLAYQESKWDSRAVSFTGVQGLMQLTESTARSLGGKDRNDPAQSIHAGSRYLGELMFRIPNRVIQPDRPWLALASYNLGLGHVLKGRTLAVNLKKNPDSWFEMKTVLRRLSKPQYYAPLNMSQARGGEAVIPVDERTQLLRYSGQY